MALLRNNFIIFSVFFAFYLLFFIKYPLDDALPFTCDGFIYTALANRFYNFLVSLFGGGDQGIFFYGVKNIYAYGEFAPAHSFLYGILKVFLRTDVITSYVYLSLVYGSNAFATFLVSRTLTQNTLAAVFAGFVFTFSNFAFANNDDYYVFTLAPAILSFYFLVRYYKENRLPFLLLAATFCATQIYFSVQSFAYALLLFFLYVCFQWRITLQKGLVKQLLFGITTLIIIALPLFLIYLNNHLNHFPVNVWGDSTGLYARVEHFLRPLPDSWLGQLIKLEPVKLNWFTIKLHMFSGITYLLLAAYCFRRPNKTKYFLLSLALLGALFALGKVIHAFGFKFTSPLKLLYDNIPLAEYLRVSWRSYFLATFALAMLSGMGIASLLERYKKQALYLFAAFLLIHALENVSYPPNKYEYSKYPYLSQGYLEYFAQKNDAVIFDLPTNAISVPEYFDDTIYMLYQTKHRRNILGGVFGYFPPNRLLAHKYLYRMPEQNSIAYFKEVGLTHFVYHKRFKHIRNHMSLDFFYFTIEKERKRLNQMGAKIDEELIDSRSFIEDYSWLWDNDFLQKEYEDDEVIIFTWR